MKKDPITPQNANCFFENRKKPGFHGLVGFKNLVELLKNETKKISGQKLIPTGSDELFAIRNKKVSPAIVDNIAGFYGYYFYHYLNSVNSPLTEEESKAVCFYRVVKNIHRVSLLLEIEQSVCRRHLIKGIRVLILEETFKDFTQWASNFETHSDVTDCSILQLPILKLKQFLPKSLVFTLATKGSTLQEVLKQNDLDALSQLRGMGKSKLRLLTEFLEAHQITY